MEVVMAEYIEDCFEIEEEREEGHVDSHSINFDCENPDKHLGCDLDIECTRII